MSNTSTSEKVCRHTGIADIDRLLELAGPETVTAAFVCMRLPFLSNVLADRLNGALEQRVEQCQGDVPGCQLAEGEPVRLWLDVLERVQRNVTEYGLDVADDYRERELSPGMVAHLDHVHGAERRQAVQEALRKAHAAA